MQKFSLKKTVGLHDPKTVLEFLARHTDLSKRRIRDAMNKGAVQLKRVKGKQFRIRRATMALEIGDRISLFYDEKLLALTPPAAKCVSDHGRYSVWFKPAGLMTQGTDYGDHCSLLRAAEIFFKSKRKIFLIHRLDREGAGLLLLAHDKGAAGKLSQLFQRRSIVKSYRAQVLGNLAQKKSEDTIQIPLDGKPAVTKYRAHGYEPSSNTTLVDVLIPTGRKHQIRRHFDMIGFPVMGDPRYGTGNKNTDGLKLVAISLEFECPFSGKYREYNL